MGRDERLVGEKWGKIFIYLFIIIILIIFIIIFICLFIFWAITEMIRGWIHITKFHSNLWDYVSSMQI